MPFIVLGVILLLLWILDIGPVGSWKWYTVLSPFVVAFIWWEVIAPMIGWDKRQAAKKMKEQQEEAQAWKKKTRGF